VGVANPEKTWYLAEGCTQNGYETWVLVQNPNKSPADIKITYMTPDGPVPGPVFSLPAESRATFNVGDTVPQTWSVSTMVTVTNNQPVVAERAIYGDPR
jgi:hypothetical protein